MDPFLSPTTATLQGLSSSPESPVNDWKDEVNATYRKKLSEEVKKGRDMERKANREMRHIMGSATKRPPSARRRSLDTASSRRRTRAQKKYYNLKAEGVAARSTGPTNKSVDGPVETPQKATVYRLETNPNDPKSPAPIEQIGGRRMMYTPAKTKAQTTYNQSIRLRETNIMMTRPTSAPATRSAMYVDHNRPPSPGQFIETTRQQHSPQKRPSQFKGFSANPVTAMATGQGLMTSTYTGGLQWVRGQAVKRRPLSANFLRSGRGKTKSKNKTRVVAPRLVSAEATRQHSGMNLTISPVPRSHGRPQSAAVTRSESPTYADFLQHRRFDSNGNPAVNATKLIGVTVMKDGNEIVADEEQKRLAREYYDHRQANLDVDLDGSIAMGSSLVAGSIEEGSIVVSYKVDQGNEEEGKDNQEEKVEQVGGNGGGGEGVEAVVEPETIFPSLSIDENVQVKPEGTHDFENHAAFAEWVRNDVDVFMKKIRDATLSNRPVDVKAFVKKLIK